MVVTIRRTSTLIRWITRYGSLHSQGRRKKEAALGAPLFYLPAREQIGLGPASLEGMDAAT